MSGLVGWVEVSVRGYRRVVLGVGQHVMYYLTLIDIHIDVALTRPHALCTQSRLIAHGKAVKQHSAPYQQTTVDALPQLQRTPTIAKCARVTDTLQYAKQCLNSAILSVHSTLTVQPLSHRTVAV